MTVQFYAVGSTISEDSAKFVTAGLDSVSVGAGLPAIALGQLALTSLVDHYRRQASSHILNFM